MATIKTTGTLQATATDAPAPVVETPIHPMQAPPEAVLLNTPMPLSGSELAAVIVFRVAERLAQILDNGSKFGESVAYPGVRFSADVNLKLEFDTPTGAVNNNAMHFETGGLRVNAQVHPRLRDLVKCTLAPETAATSMLMEYKVDDVKIDTRLHPSLVEMLRVEAGLGLWHRQHYTDGRFQHIQARPIQKVMEHLLELATDLGKQSGMKAGLNK